MLRDTFLAFDDEIRGPTTTTYYTDDSLNLRFGAWDQTVLCLEVLDGTFTGTLTTTVTLEHSGNAGTRIASGTSYDWVAKFLDLDETITTLVSVTNIGASWGIDFGAMPKLRFARLAISTGVSGGTFTSARIRIFAAMRDSGGGHPFGLPMTGRQ